MSKNLSYIIRKATVQDVPTILHLIKELAKYEKAPDAVVNTEDDLRRDFDKYFHCLLAETTNDKKPCGFALYFYTYSTWEGRVLYLEDIFVPEEYRGKGIGTALFRQLAQIAKDSQCKRFQWQVLDWNVHSINFYKSLGAKALPEWITMRFDKTGINQFLLNSKKKTSNMT